MAHGGTARMDLAHTPRRAPSLAALDLNLLVVFDALMQTRSVSRAAEMVGLSQPAASNALRRLRDLLGDELLVRHGQTMEPTARARQLHPAVAEAMAGISDALWGDDHFNPRTAERTFRIALTDSCARMVLPRLIPRLMQIAPGVTIQVTTCGMIDGAARILSGELDLGVGVYLDLPRGLKSRTLTREMEMACVASKDNRRLKNGAMDIDAYIASPHVVVGINGDPGVTIDMAVAALGVVRKVAVVVPYFSAVPPLVRGTELVGPCDTSALDGLSYADELAVFPPPFPTQPLTLKAVWRASAAHDVALRWLVAEIGRVIPWDLLWQLRDSHSPAE